MQKQCILFSAGAASIKKASAVHQLVQEPEIWLNEAILKKKKNNID